MDRNEFLDKVMRIMEERLGEGYEVKREETLKNNGVRESGILVRKGKIGTIFYLAAGRRPAGMCRPAPTDLPGDIQGGERLQGDGRGHSELGKYPGECIPSPAPTGG